MSSKYQNQKKGGTDTKQIETKNESIIQGFQQEESNSDEYDENIPKNAKLSKNLGLAQTKSIISTCQYSKAFSMVTPRWATYESKQHPRHRPINKYFEDKVAVDNQQQAEEQIQQDLQKKQKLEKVNELQKVRELIKAEKNKVKICVLCQRKFANAAHLQKHEIYSELHKKIKANPSMIQDQINMMQIKIANSNQ